MAKFNIEIVETISGVFEIEAETLEDALELAEQQYNDGDIILDGYSNSATEHEVRESR